MRKSRNVCAVIVLAMVCMIAAATPARADTAEGWFDFKKYAPDQTNSRLSWSWNNRATQRVSTMDLARAGSGVTENECEVGKGWLPNGWYDEKQMADHFAGSKVWGRVWQLQDKKCSKGTYRTQLFIHTEETPDNGQVGCGTGSDMPQCWDGTVDYKSNGCVKVAWSPDGSASGIGYLHSKYHDTTRGGDARHGVHISDELYVH